MFAAACPRQPRVRRLLRARRRPGRARVRRPLLRRRPHRRDDRARRAVPARSCCVCDVDLDGRRGRAAARRRPSPRPRGARRAGSSCCPRSPAPRAPSARRPPTAADRAARAGRGRGVCGARRSACATTSRRTASTHVVLGLSGGIDSALVACLAVDALGAERVSVAIMPSPLLLLRHPGRRPRAGRRARRAHARAADRAGDGRLRRDARAPSSPARASPI